PMTRRTAVAARPSDERRMGALRTAFAQEKVLGLRGTSHITNAWDGLAARVSARLALLRASRAKSLSTMGFLKTMSLMVSALPTSMPWSARRLAYTALAESAALRASSRAVAASRSR